MSRFFRFAAPASGRRICTGLFAVLAVAALLAAGARAQTFPTQLHDTSALHPPAGAHVAIVEFDDLECPACAEANPYLEAAAKKYGIPWIRHDFLIPLHVWSANAAVNARWFDTQSKALGNEYRDQVFANQRFIYNREMLGNFTSDFASQHHVTMPFSIDPQGKLEAEVQADDSLGKRMGINHTPTVFVVKAGGKGSPYIEVQNPEQDIDRIVAQALADTTPIKTAHLKKAARK